MQIKTPAPIQQSLFGTYRVGMFFIVQLRWFIVEMEFVSNNTWTCAWKRSRTNNYKVKHPDRRVDVCMTEKAKKKKSIVFDRVVGIFVAFLTSIHRNDDLTELTSLICGYFFFVSWPRFLKSFWSTSRNFWAASLPVVPLTNAMLRVRFDDYFTFLYE